VYTMYVVLFVLPVTILTYGLTISSNSPCDLHNYRGLLFCTFEARTKSKVCITTCFI